MHSEKQGLCLCVCKWGCTLRWLCSRYGCHISASSTFHPAVCGEKQFVSRSPTPSALHRSLLFHHRKAMLRWPQRTPVWVDRKYLSVHARVSYSRPILILNRLQNENGAGIMCNRQWKSGSLWLFLFFFLSGEKKPTSSVLNGLISSALCRVLREMKIQNVRHARGLIGEIHIWLEGDDI